MGDDSTLDNQQVLAVLLPALELSVSLRILELRGVSDDRRVELARGCSQHVAEHGDLLMYRSARAGETAEAFNKLALGIAACAYQPGGVTLFGRHWCVDHAACLRAEEE